MLDLRWTPDAQLRLRRAAAAIGVPARELAALEPGAVPVAAHVAPAVGLSGNETAPRWPWGA